MSRFFIACEVGVGYVVTELVPEMVPSIRKVRCFGQRQSDAMEFRNDCNNGKIDERRIEMLVRSYSKAPYRYLGNGNLAKEKSSGTEGSQA